MNNSKNTSGTNNVANMHYLVSHFKTLLPQRRKKRRRGDDNNMSVMKPRTQGDVDITSVDCRVNETTQKPSPNQTT